MSEADAPTESTTSTSAQLSFAVVPPPRKDGERASAASGADPLSSYTPLYDLAPAPSSSKRYYEDCRPISESDIRNSLLVEAKRRRSWGAKTIEKMQFESVEHSRCYHYTLESFTETRSTAHATESCNLNAMVEAHGLSSVRVSLSGGGFDRNSHPRGSSVASIQNPWDYEVLPSSEFVGQVCNNDGISHCFHCRGNGTDKCGYCRGTGMKAGVAHPALYTHPMVATYPHSDQGHGHHGFGAAIVRPPAGSRTQPYALGTPVHFMARAGLPPPGIGQHDLCIFCQGRGIRECHHCKGHGKRPCSTCAGHGTVRQYVKLKVFFTVERSDYFTPCELPEAALRPASGEIGASETQNYASPIKKFPVAAINEASRRFCAQHLQKSLGSSRVIKQRQTVEIIPIAKVHFKLNAKKSGLFYVYGNERLCWIPKSPSKCALM